MIYENICKLAKERGISINKLEEKANVSTGSICKWGNSVSPTVKNIKKVRMVVIAGLMIEIAKAIQAAVALQSI